MICMNIYKKIMEIRKDNNLTQEEFAEKLNVSRQTVSNWENSKCYPDIETLIIISDKFNASLDYLLKDNVEMIKDIDRKVWWSKKLIYGICSLFIILVLSIGVIYFKNNKLNQVKKENVKLENNIKTLTNVPSGYTVFSLDAKKVNFRELSLNDNGKIDIYVCDNKNKVILDKPLISNVSIISYLDYEGSVTTEIEDIANIVIMIPDEIFIALTYANLNTKIIVQDSINNGDVIVNKDVLNYVNYNLIK